MSKFRHYSPEFKAHRLFPKYAAAVAIMDSECKPNGPSLSIEEYNDAYYSAGELHEQISSSISGRFVTAKDIFG